MSQHVANLFECPMFKIQDRRTICERVYQALLRDNDAVLDFKGEMHRYTREELSNWEARETIAKLLLAFPSSEKIGKPDQPPPSEVESSDLDTVDELP